MKTTLNRPDQTKSTKLNILNPTIQTYQTKHIKNISTKTDKFKFALSLAQLSPSLLLNIIILLNT